MNTNEKEAVTAKLRPHLTDQELEEFWENYDGTSLKGRDAGSIISVGFAWLETKQGYEYWDRITRRIRRGEMICREVTTPPTLQDLIDAVRQWGEDKGITGPHGKGTLLGQLSKSQEELTETRDAAALYVNGAEYMTDKKGRTALVRDELKDGLGDTMVTLILAAEMAGLRIEDCLAAAYEVISKRTGRMENGVFVKDA